MLRCLPTQLTPIPSVLEIQVQLPHADSSVSLGRTYRAGAYRHSPLPPDNRALRGPSDSPVPLGQLGHCPYRSEGPADRRGSPVRILGAHCKLRELDSERAVDCPRTARPRCNPLPTTAGLRDLQCEFVVTDDDADQSIERVCVSVLAFRSEGSIRTY